MPYAQIGPIAVYLPQRIETNDQLQAEHPNWDLSIIGEKTGIMQRHVAGPGETASDLAVAASEKLFADYDIDRQSIDFVLLCTQTPDYPLPTSACLIQDRLGLPAQCGALDYNLGCSGFVYGLAMADGLIQSSVANNILLLTAETYTKYIDQDDRSLRTIFGDAAAATLVQANSKRSLWGFKFGTDGSGADTLLVSDGGARPAEDAHKPRHRKRWKSRLYMDGPSLINFTVGAVPKLIEEIVQSNGLQMSDVKRFLLHQATFKMLEQLQKRLDVDDSRLPIRLRDVGNTVSATVPILIDELRTDGTLDDDGINALVGFGVGWSWAGCLWKDSFGQGERA